MYQSMGLSGLVTLLSHFFFITLTFKLLLSLDMNKWFKPHQVRASQLLVMFLAIAIGYNVSEFVLSLVQSAQSLPLIFK
ncbi:MULTISPECIES: DUF1146 family protein [Lacticaseibacillus]|uniref:DUF1146 family protein n=2 Tax=Lacticaseibacillus TaxID=2759736 RepID=A0ABW4CL81_9LACO|nr:MULTISPECIES: DUF1146 family protein [Lacticaseibacillus]